MLTQFIGSLLGEFPFCSSNYIAAWLERMGRVLKRGEFWS